MLVGIISDTHDQYDRTAAALDLLRDAKVERVIHCGDVCSGHVLTLFKGMQTDLVLGNNDHTDEMQDASRDAGVTFHGAMADLLIDGKHVTVMHGDDGALKQRVIAEQQADYLLLGHTHVQTDRPAGRTRVINPGALHRAKAWSVAVLDVAGGALRFLAVR